MRIFVTLDYEVFFGARTGSAERTLLAPTAALARIAERRAARFVFFVDAGYLLRLRDEARKDAELRREYDAVARQVAKLAGDGHEIQLHVHPHWEDSYWTPRGWHIDTRRYALHAFGDGEIREIVARYAAMLRSIAGPRSAFAYRAGGWVIQPFSRLRPALRDAGVAIDSTVYAGGRSGGRVQPFDFRGAPAKSRWRFEDDPLREVADGAFLEMPIASRRLGPLFFWKLACAKKLGGPRHRAFGDGAAIPLERPDLVRKLTRASASVVSLDGYKASFLEAAARDYRARGMQDFVVIGHPKAVTPDSLERLDRFLGSLPRGDEVATFAACA